MATFNITKRAFARERLTVSSTVKTLTAATYRDVANGSSESKATGARITVESNSIRFTEEGTAPNVGVGTEVGTLAASGDIIVLESYEAISKFKALRVSADASIEVVYYRS